MNIVIISGSPRQGSLSHRAALFLSNHLKKTSTHNIHLVSLQEWRLPFIQNVWTSIDKVPAEFQTVYNIISGANAFILVTPEYNGGYSSAMKNLLDHFPKQYHKPFGIVTCSPGAMGGIRASQQMQLLTAALFGILSPYMLVTPLVDKKFDADGHLTDPSFQSSIDQFIYEFLWLSEKIVNKN